jgi:hypothetical protein
MTIAMMPALRTNSPCASRPSTACIKPGAVELSARVPQTRDFDHGVAEAKARPGWQAEQIEFPRSDVFPELAGGDRVSFGAEFLEQLVMDQMNLPEVGLVWIVSHARSVLHGLSRVSVSINAVSGDEQNAKLIRLAESVGRTSADRDDGRTHGDLGSSLRPNVMHRGPGARKL